MRPTNFFLRCTRAQQTFYRNTLEIRMCSAPLLLFYSCLPCYRQSEVYFPHPALGSEQPPERDMRHVKTVVLNVHFKTGLFLI